MSVGLVLFLGVTIWLGYFGCKKTRDVADFAIAGGKMGPVVLGTVVKSSLAKGFCVCGASFAPEIVHAGSRAGILSGVSGSGSLNWSAVVFLAEAGAPSGAFVMVDGMIWMLFFRSGFRKGSVCGTLRC